MPENQQEMISLDCPRCGATPLMEGDALKRTNTTRQNAPAGQGSGTVVNGFALIFQSQHWLHPDLDAADTPEQ